jgi:hypothetical protein
MKPEVIRQPTQRSHPGSSEVSLTPKITDPSYESSETPPSYESSETKVIVQERLGELEKKLELLTNSLEPRAKKARDKRRSEIKYLTLQIDNSKAYLSLSEGTKVTEGTKLGVITHLTLSPGGMPEVWVTWHNYLYTSGCTNVPIPEQPIRLKPEPFLEQLKVGDSITINSKHPEAAQKSFEIKEFRGDGWILTKNEKLFHHDFLELPSLVSSETDEDLSTQDEVEIVSEISEESVSEIVGETIDETHTETIDETQTETGKDTPEMSETVNPSKHEQSTNTIVEIVEEPQSSNLSKSGFSKSAPTEYEELSHDEQRDRLHLERKVERAFYEAGIALQELRDRRLYRSTHKTFEQYCAERFGFQRRHPYRLIDAADVVDNLIGTQFHELGDDSQMCPNGTQTEMRTIGTQTGNETNLTTNGTQNDDIEMCPIGTQTESNDEMCPNGAQILPTSERQVRPLTKLEPDQQREVWQKAVAAAGGKVPSGRIVKNIVDQIRQKNPVPNPWRKGEVAMIMVKDNPDLRGKGGCWAVITEVHNFSCTVRLWDGNYQVKPENLKELPYSNEQQEMVRKLCDRLSLLYDPEMEETAKAILASLGKIDRPWLTELEERLLRVLE